MSDSWIDKNELDRLISGFTPNRRSDLPHQIAPEDIFDDIPSRHIPPQAGRVSPHLSPAAQVEPSSSPLQVLVKRSNQTTPDPAAPQKITSPFLLDEDDDEFDDIESHIEHLASETAKALKVLQEARAKADRNGLIAKVENPAAEPVFEAAAFELDEDVEEILQPLDRIPLNVEIDPHLSLKGRLQSLAGILKAHVGMEEMIIVDRDGFSLFSTRQSLTVEKSVGKFVRAIRRVYDSGSNARSHTASQLAVENDKWICIIPTDGEIDGKFLLKALLPTPLDRPEIYVLVELLNEVLRPETG